MIGAPLADARVTSLSVIAPTPECRTRTLISSVDRRESAWTIASTEPCTSALTKIGSSFTPPLSDWPKNSSRLRAVRASSAGARRELRR
jgi:hypothetical protein